jgi:hypothetical protein
VVVKKYPELANIKNVDFGQVLHECANISTSVLPEEVGSSDDEMNLKVIREKFTFLTTFVMRDTDAPGTILYNDHITPTPNTMRADLGSTFACTALEYTTLPFTFWRGDLRFRLTCVMTKIHNLRICFNLHLGRESDTIPFTQSMSQYTTVMDFTADQNTFDIVVPWKSNKQMLRTGYGSNIGEHIMGEYSIRVLNPLQTMESVNSQVEFNLYMAAGDNFKTDFMSNTGLDYRPIVYGS